MAAAICVAAPAGAASGPVVATALRVTSAPEVEGAGRRVDEGAEEVTLTRGSTSPQVHKKGDYHHCVQEQAQ
ncbi:hypothetical protein ZWY2020_018153 [Hordeum vulgare]|nr:hypothetical protein ZWY2020_018153 [Hordeum vulgare]